LIDRDAAGAFGETISVAAGPVGWQKQAPQPET
jgi:hypothetical protein